MANPRVRKIADRIHVIVAEMLERKIKDPRLGFVTVTDVRVSGDSQHASVFWTALGEETEVESSAAALESAKGLIRSEVGKQLGMRLVPTLEFIRDALPETARHLDEVLAQARASDEAVAAQRAGGDVRLGRGPVPQAASGRRGARRGRGRVSDSAPSAPAPATGPAPAAPHGLVVVDKPGGLTSHGVVARVRRLAGTRKVGHAGTLDPMATGVLVLGVGRATRLLGHLMLTEKAYDATILLGRSTTTDDAEGEVVAEHDVSGLTEEAVRRELARFVGEIDQVPTAVSAIKVDGRRAYERVRAGEEVVLKSRRVTVHELEVVEMALPEVRVRMRCSSGTYVRAIARDLGDALGVGGHLTALRRTAVGPFDLAQARTLEAARGRDDAGADRAGRPRVLPGGRPDRVPGAGGPLRPSARPRPAGRGRARGLRSRRRVPGPLRGDRWAGPARRRLRRLSHAVACDPCRSGVRSKRSQQTLGPTVVTIGNFDGVHRGHQHVLQRARAAAERLGVDQVVAVTFDPHPMAVLRPEHAPPTLTSITTRRGLAGAVGGGRAAGGPVRPRRRGLEP